MKLFVAFTLFLSFILPVTGVILCVAAPFYESVFHALVGQAMVVSGMTISNLFVKLVEYSEINKSNVYSMSDYNKHK